MNIKIFCDDYKRWCEKEQLVSVSTYMFRDIFYRKFNLRFKQPAQDTCDYCNKQTNKIQNAPLKSLERLKLMEEKKDHLQSVEYISREYKEYISESK